MVLQGLLGLCKEPKENGSYHIGLRAQWADQDIGSRAEGLGLKV